MRVDLKEGTTTVGTVILDRQGTAIADGDWDDFIQRLFVVSEEKGPDAPLKPSDGEEFLRALPGSLRGHRLKAVLVE